MIDRRGFLGVAGTLGAASLVAADGTAFAQDAGARDYYELRLYQLDTPEQKTALEGYYRDAAIPALNRAGVPQVGVFEPLEELGPLYVLVRHTSPESFATATEKLLADEEFLSKGAAVLSAPPESPAFTRIETTFMKSFSGMPTLEIPVTTPGRIFEFRNYESPNVLAGQKKIEMFNIEEIDIMRRTGMGPVFYGEHLTGPVMPNLTYLLSYDDMDARKEAWGRFMADAGWKALSGKPEFADAKILGTINKAFVKPTEFSQI
jgi:hypothetical protein